MFAFICVTVALPLGFLGPLIFSETISQASGLVFFSLLLLIPCLLTLVYLTSKIKKFWYLTRIEKIKSIKNLTLHCPLLFILMLCFVISEAALIFYYCKATYSDYAIGGVMGMIVFLPFVYTGSSITISIPFEYSNQKSNYLKLKLQILCILLWLTIFPISFIFAFSLEILGVIFVGVMKTLATGASLFLLIMLSFLEIKYKFKKYGQIAMAIGNGALWILLIVPIGVVLPIALTRTTDEKARYNYFGVAIIYLGLTFMTFVSIGSILYNYYKKKIDEEKLNVKCCGLVKVELGKRFVKSDYKIIRSIFDQFAFYEFKDEYLRILHDGGNFKSYKIDIEDIFAQEVDIVRVSTNQEKPTEKQNKKPFDKTNF